MIPADDSIQRVSLDMLVERYGVSMPTAWNWTQEPGFPDRVGQAGKLQLFDGQAVDAWLFENRPFDWLPGQPNKSRALWRLLEVPQGSPEDLMALRRIGELEGRLLRRDPVPVTTLRTYISRGKLAPADRRPEDGLQPEVKEDMWFRRTAEAFLLRPRHRRGPGKSTAGATETPAAEPQRTSRYANLELPDGDEQDLFTLDELRAFDAQARGKAKPLGLASIKQYRSQGLLAPADRTPGDGLAPAVDEEKWFRTSVYDFVRR